MSLQFLSEYQCRPLLAQLLRPSRHEESEKQAELFNLCPAEYIHSMDKRTDTQTLHLSNKA